MKKLKGKAVGRLIGFVAKLHRQHVRYRWLAIALSVAFGAVVFWGLRDLGVILYGMGMEHVFHRIGRSALRTTQRIERTLE